MPASQGIAESTRPQGRFRPVATHRRLGVLAVGTPIDPAELDSIRAEIELKALPEGDPVWSPTGPFAVVAIPFPRGWKPETLLSAPFEVMDAPTSREDASRNAVRFNELQIPRAPIARWATVWTGSNGGGRVLIVAVDAPEWRPFSPYDFPTGSRAVHVSQREAKRIAREINAPFTEGRLPTEWAVVIRHAAEDVHAFNLATEGGAR